MDSNRILISLVLLTTVVNLGRLLSHPLRRRSRWVLVYGGVLALMALGLIIIPGWIGYLGGVVWGIFTVIPIIGIRVCQWCTLSQHFRLGYAVSRLIAFLHPGDGFEQLPKVAKGLLLTREGRFKEAAELLGEAGSPQRRKEFGAALHYFRMSQRWEELLAMLEELPLEDLRRDPEAAGMYVRALGEHGDVEGMVEHYLRLEQVINAGGQLPGVQLAVLALAGRKDSVAALLGGPLRSLTPQMRELWMATAELASGHEGAGLARLSAVPPSRDPLVDTFVARRRDRPVRVIGDSLSPRAREIVDVLGRVVDEESRYGEAGSGVPVVTYVLAAITAFGFFVQYSLGATSDYLALLQVGAFQGASFLAGDWWRIFTAQFLHAGFAHLFFNLTALYLLGPFIERALGRTLYPVAYLASGAGAYLVIGAATAAGLLSPMKQLVGASAGIMGLVGITAGLMLRCWYSDGAGQAWSRFKGALSIIGLQVIFDVLTPQVSMLAHLLGAIIGFIIGTLVPHRLRAKHELRP